ncbi:MAG: carbohydrate binding domain-containing protein [Polyangiaceae bacterium]
MDVTVVNADNDVASIQVTPTSGLQTNESGTTATFTVVLGAQPSAPVTIGLKSSDVSEGTVLPSTLAFTSANWSVPQTVTVTGVNDDANDSSVIYTIETTAASSTDPAYSDFPVPDVTVTNLDDEEISPVVLVSPTSGLSTTEAGGKATFTLRLSSAPLASVGVSITSSDATEASLTPSTIIFTSTNWSTPQTVTVTGLDDGIDDGDVAYTLITSPTVSADPNYSALDVPDVSATNVDDDKVGIIVSAKDILQTTETGGTATFTVALACQPSSTVVIPLSSTDTTEGAVSPASLSFTTANWNIPQTVTVTGMNDVLDDNDVGYSIVTGAASSLDPAYSGLDASDVIVINADNDPVVPCADPLMIDDVEDGDLTICGNGGRVGTWYTNDSSTIVTPSLAVLPTVRSDSSICMETIASGTTNWATLGFTLKGTSIAARLPYDVSAYTGLRFWARRGSASSYPSSVTVQLLQANTTTIAEGGTCSTSVYECSDHYAYAISVSTAWAEYQLPFASFYQSSTWGSYFPRDLASVLAIEFLMKSNSSYDLQVDDVRFY